MDKILFETLELPDLRIADKAGPFDIFLPWYTRKSQIVNPQKVERDWLTNKFMAKPDYEDPHKKVFYATFAGMKVAALSAALEVASMKSRNPTKAIAIAGKNFAYIGGIFLTYGAVVSMVANLRGKKDDIFNHAAGGASLGFIFGFTKRCSGQGAAFGLFAAIAGMLFKTFYQNDRPFVEAFINGPRELNFQHGGFVYGEPNGTSRRQPSPFY